MENNLVGEIEISYKKNTSFEKFAIKSSKDAEKFLRDRWPSDINLKESFMVLYLSNCMEVVGVSTLSIGTLTSTVVDVKEVVRVALMTGKCNAVILAHNHPSGRKEASEPDKKITEKIKKALELFDMKLIDHIILTPEKGILSFTDEGLI